MAPRGRKEVGEDHLMKTLEFTRDLREITQKLKVEEILKTLDPWMFSAPNSALTETDKDKFYGLLADSRAGYDQLTLSGRMLEILNGLGVPEFYEPATLRRLTLVVSNAGNIHNLRPSTEITAYREKLQSVQRTANTCQKLLEAEKVGKVEKGGGIVELELSDYDGEGIEPERLRLLAITVRQMHTNFARVYAIEGDQLRFKYFDSGTSVLIGIQCAAGIALGIGTLMLQWWKETRFSNNDNFDRKVGSVSKGLTLLKDVQDSVEKNVIDEETGKIITRHLLKEAERLLGIGAALPMDTEASVNQRERLLARRDIKLLESGAPIEEEDDEPKGGETA